MVFVLNGEPRLIRLPYESVESALTPSEKEVAFKLGAVMHRVLVPDSTVDTQSRTIQVSVIANAQGRGTYLVDLGGDSLGTFRRVEVTFEVLEPFLRHR